MFIRFSNGSIKEGVLVSRTEATLRIALRGDDDVTELKRAGEGWATSDCEPVAVMPCRPRVSMDHLPEDYFVCSHELAARLVDLLLHPERSRAACDLKSLSAGSNLRAFAC
jgi:hypothetical protein